MSPRIAGLAVTATALVLTGCSASTSSGFSDSAGGDHTARFVQQPWADAVV